jgi:hypothetical protein
MKNTKALRVDVAQQVKANMSLNMAKKKKKKKSDGSCDDCSDCNDCSSCGD